MASGYTFPYVGIKPHILTKPNYYNLDIKFPDKTDLTFKLFIDGNILEDVVKQMYEKEYDVHIGNLALSTSFYPKLYLKSDGRLLLYPINNIQFYLSPEVLKIVRDKINGFFADYILYLNEPDKYKVESEY